MAIYTGTTTSKRGSGKAVWLAFAAVIVSAVLIFALAIGSAGGGSGPNIPPQGQSGTKVQLSHGSGWGDAPVVTTRNGICARCAP